MGGHKLYNIKKRVILLFYLHAELSLRETREGWPLLTVETDVNRDSKNTNKRGPYLVVLLG